MFKVKVLGKLLLALVLSFESYKSLATDLNEDSLLAAYLFKFSKYTTWPELVAPGVGKSINYCIHKELGVYEELKKVEGRLVEGIPISFQFSEDLRGFNTCHILYTSDRFAESRELLEPYLKTQTLLVGHEDQEYMLNLERKDKRVFFTANLKTLGRTSIILSSEVLKLASLIHKK